MTVETVYVQPDDLRWGFDDSAPFWRTTSQIGAYGHAERVDPCRAYAHGEDLVGTEVSHVTSSFPIGVPVTFHVSPWESVGRTNGWCAQEWNYYSGDNRDEKRWEAAIALVGKRIPPMPAMTRYLVSHEYGHAVDYWLCHVRELGSDGLDEEYRKLRGLGKPGHYGPGSWHENVGEVIANDFRIVVCKREREFWPHPCEHPLKDPAVRAWWRKALKEVA